MLSPMTKQVATGNRNLIALQAETADSQVALCAAITLPSATGTIPEWVHLLPAGPEVRTFDARGPYSLADLPAVALASQQAAADRGAPIDENHATDLAAPQGLPAPARGWITEFEARADGIWGRVEWTEGGKALMAERAYRGISPVIVHDARKRVIAIARASLVNKPNLRGLEALNQETDMDLLAKLAAKLGLATGTSEDALLTAVGALQTQATALQSQLAPIATAVGLDANATAEAVLGAVNGLRSQAPAGSLEALQAELTEVTTKLNALQTETARKAATAFVDGAIAEKRVGVAPLRDHYIAMHMENPARVEKEIGAMPKLGATHTGATPPAQDGTQISLNAEQLAVARQLGLDPKDYAATLAAEQAASEAAA